MQKFDASRTGWLVSHFFGELFRFVFLLKFRQFYIDQERHCWSLILSHFEWQSAYNSFVRDWPLFRPWKHHRIMASSSCLNIAAATSFSSMASGTSPAADGRCTRQIMPSRTGAQRNGSNHLLASQIKQEVPSSWTSSMAVKGWICLRTCWLQSWISRDKSSSCGLAVYQLTVLWKVLRNSFRMWHFASTK